MLTLFLILCCTMIGESARSDPATAPEAAAAICSGTQDIDLQSTTGNAKYKDLKLEITDGGKTLKLKNQGVLLAQITDFSYATYTECLQTMIKALDELNKQPAPKS
jgi:hypothetical protein